jgi:hypothetical protein
MANGESLENQVARRDQGQSNMQTNCSQSKRCSNFMRGLISDKLALTPLQYRPYKDLRNPDIR